MHAAIYIYRSTPTSVYNSLFFLSRVFVPSTVSCVAAPDHRVPAASLLCSPSGTIHSLYRAVIAQSPNKRKPISFCAQAMSMNIVGSGSNQVTLIQWCHPSTNPSIDCWLFGSAGLSLRCSFCSATLGVRWSTSSLVAVLSLYLAVPACHDHAVLLPLPLLLLLVLLLVLLVPLLSSSWP